MYLRKGDKVVVIAGSDKGKEGTVEKETFREVQKTADAKKTEPGNYSKSCFPGAKCRNYGFNQSQPENQ